MKDRLKTEKKQTKRQVVTDQREIDIVTIADSVVACSDQRLYNKIVTLFLFS